MASLLSRVFGALSRFGGKPQLAPNPFQGPIPTARQAAFQRQQGRDATRDAQLAQSQADRFQWADTSTWSHPHIEVSSSDLKSVAFDVPHRLLQVKFLKEGPNSGDTYNYPSVDPSVYFGLMAAPSKGVYFHANIRCSYSYSDLSGKSELKGCDAQGGIRGSGPMRDYGRGMALPRNKASFPGRLKGR